MFLGYWDRRVNGYHLSTQGIPQEIIGDASRTLANFYIDKFDEKMIEFTKSENQVYIRWADDIIVFGKSPQSLEQTIHKASRFLLHDGLNLNAAKTRIFSRNEFRAYRGIDVLNAVGEKRHSRVTPELRKFLKHASNHGGRIDTVYRAMLPYAARNKSHVTPYVASFLEDRSREYEYLGTLSFSQIKQRIEISRSPAKTVKEVQNIICRYPYAAGRAS